jgi:hypothetical protein
VVCWLNQRAGISYSLTKLVRRNYNNIILSIPKLMEILIWCTYSSLLCGNKLYKNISTKGKSILNGLRFLTPTVNWPLDTIRLIFYCPMAIKSGILVELGAEYVGINYQIFWSRILSEYYICYKFKNFVEYFAVELIFFNLIMHEMKAGLLYMEWEIGISNV